MNDEANFEEKNNKSENISSDLFPKIYATFFIKNQLLYQRNYQPTVIFEDLIADFEKNFKDPQTRSKLEYRFRNRKINKNDKVMDIAKPEKNSKLLEIDVKIDVSEYRIPEISRVKKHIYNQIIKPLYKPFGLIVFKPKENKISYDKYDDCHIINNYLEEFSENSAYCNTDDSLFMSGGEASQIPLNYFWKIDHKRKFIEQSEMPFSKSKHSMLYIPNNYIFFAGGTDKNTFYYDIKNKTYSIWADMNNECERPGLILVDGHILYAFHTFENDINYFEKTDLENFPFWQIIIPKIKSSPFDLKYYTVSLLNDEEVILFGGNNEGNNKKCFIYNIQNNELDINDCPNEIILNNGDNKAYKINKYNSVIIPDDFEANKEIIILNGFRRALKKIGYKTIRNEIMNREMMNYSISNIKQIHGNISLEIKTQKLEEVVNEPLESDETLVNEKNQAIKKINGTLGKAILGKNLQILINNLMKENKKTINGIYEKEIDDSYKEKEIQNQVVNKKNKNEDKQENIGLNSRGKVILKSIQLSTPKLRKDNINLEKPPLEQGKENSKKDIKPKLKKLKEKQLNI